MRCFALMLLSVLFSGLASGVAQAAPWSGVYVLRGDKGLITLTLREGPEGVEGTLSGGGATFKLAGDLNEEGEVEGLALDGNGTPTSVFTMKRVGESILMELGDGEKVQGRLTFAPQTPGQGAAPAAKEKEPEDVELEEKEPVKTAPVRPTTPKVVPKVAPKPAQKEAPREPEGGPQAGGADWKTYTHPIGLKFRHPASWKVQSATGMLSLVPPDAKSDERGPTELYLVAGEGANGITSSQDPRVVAYLDGQLKQLAPFLERVGEVKGVRSASSPGVMAIWEGTNPLGKLVQARVYTTILNGVSVAVIGFGLKNQIAARESVVRTVFTSLGVGVGKRDPQVVGAWKFWSYKGSADGKFGVEKTRFFTLRPDGSCTWSGRSETSASVTGRDSLGNTTLNGGLASASNSGDVGKWSADAGQLYVLWNDGDTSTWGYRLGGVVGNRRLFLKGNGPEDEWVETR